MAINAVVLDQGYAAWQVASTQVKLEFTKVQLGTNEYTPVATQTDIKTPYSPAKSFNVVGVKVSVINSQVHLEFYAEDVSTDIYGDVGEIGVYFDYNGVDRCFAIASDPNGLGSTYRKVSDQLHVFRFQLILDRSVHTGTLDVGNLVMAVATDQVHGLNRRATTSEIASRTGDGVVIASRLPLEPGQTVGTWASTYAWDVSTDPDLYLTLGGNTTMSEPTNLVSGEKYILTIKQDTTGSRTITWNSIFDWTSIGATAPILQTAAGAIDTFGFVYQDSKLRLIGHIVLED